MKSHLTSWLLILLLITSPLLFSGCKTSSGPNYKMNLEVWGVFDDSEVFSRINQEYRRNNPQIVEIRYRKVSSDMANYERELFDAIAAGNGPDVFFFHNTWLMKHQNKLAPLPSRTNSSHVAGGLAIPA